MILVLYLIYTVTNNLCILMHHRNDQRELMTHLLDGTRLIESMPDCITL